MKHNSYPPRKSREGLCWSLFSAEWLLGLYGTWFWAGCCVRLNLFLLLFPLSFSFFPPIPKFLSLESRPQEMWLLPYAAPRKSVESVNQSRSVQRLIDTGGHPCPKFRSHELTFFEKRVLADVSNTEIVSSDIIWCGVPKSNDQCPDKMPKGEIYRGGQVVVEAGPRAMSPPASQGPAGIIRSWTGSGRHLAPLGGA